MQRTYRSRQWGFDRRWRGSGSDVVDGVGGVGVHEQGRFAEKRKREQCGGREDEEKTRRRVGEATAEAEAEARRRRGSLADCLDRAAQEAMAEATDGGESVSWFTGRFSTSGRRERERESKLLRCGAGGRAVGAATGDGGGGGMVVR